MQLDRSKYKVLVNSKEQAERFKQVLLALGEEVFQGQNGYEFYNGGEPFMVYSATNNWICVEGGQSCETISIKDLAKLIVNEEKPAEKEFKVGNRVKVIKTENCCYGALGQTGIIVSDDAEATNGCMEGGKWDYKIKIGVNVWRVKGEFELVKPGLLDGKCAIQVNNEREFKLLMEHYESKGWRGISGKKAGEVHLSIFIKDNYWTYHDIFSQSASHGRHNPVPFATFAKEVNIKVPVFVMKSFDGKDLFEGDESYVPQKRGDTKTYSSVWMLLVGRSSDSSTRFSTRQAAEDWVKEKNKPKEITVQHIGGKSIVRKDKVWILVDGSKTWVNFDTSDLIDIYNASQSLQ